MHEVGHGAERGVGNAKPDPFEVTFQHLDAVTPAVRKRGEALRRGDLLPEPLRCAALRARANQDQDATDVQFLATSHKLFQQHLAEEARHAGDEPDGFSGGAHHWFPAPSRFSGSTAAFTARVHVRAAGESAVLRNPCRILPTP